MRKQTDFFRLPNRVAKRAFRCWPSIDEYFRGIDESINSLASGASDPSRLISLENALRNKRSIEFDSDARSELNARLDRITRLKKSKQPSVRVKKKAVPEKTTANEVLQDDLFAVSNIVHSYPRRKEKEEGVRVDWLIAVVMVLLGKKGQQRRY